MGKRKKKQKRQSWADKYHHDVWGDRVSPRIPPLTQEQEQERKRKQAEISEHASRELARWEAGVFQPKAKPHRDPSPGIQVILVAPPGSGKRR